MACFVPIWLPFLTMQIMAFHKSKQYLLNGMMTGLKSDSQPSSKSVMQHLCSIEKKNDYYVLRDLACGRRGKPTSQKMNGANAC